MFQNHKGFITFGMLIAIFILIVGTIVILGIYKMAFAGVEPEMMKKICKTSNMLILGLKEKVPMSEYVTMRGRACKTIPIESPSDAYPQTKEGAKDELRNSIIECADEWLMGIAEPGDVTGEKWWPLQKNKCFVCREYKIKKDVESFGVKEFEASLHSTAYRANDASDRCASTGGYCAEKCDDLKEREDLKALEVNFRQVSGECEKNNEVCCVPEAPECVRRGGRCYLLGTGTCREINQNYPIRFRGWSCDNEDKTCCVKDEYADTYYEEIRYNRAGNILIDKDIDKFIKVGEEGADVYAVVFVDKNPRLKGEISVFIKTLLLATYVVEKAEDLYIFFRKKFGEEYIEPPYIYIGKFKDAVEKAKCAKMRDIGGK